MKPAAWVRNLTDPQPHCVTDLRYMSAADVDAGVQYVPLYTAPKILCGCGDQIMPNDNAECGNCVAARNAVKPQPVAQVHVAEDYYPHVIWAEGINAACFDQEYLYLTPPQREWQGLTEMEVMDICNFAKGQNGFFFVREIEAKLKEKNHAI